MTAKIWQTIGFTSVGVAVGLMGFFTDDYKICIAIMTVGNALD